MFTIDPARKIELINQLKNFGVIDLTKEYDCLQDINLADKDSAQMIMLSEEHEKYINSELFQKKDSQKKQFKSFAINESRKLNNNEEKIFSLDNGQYLYFINKKYIISMNTMGDMFIFSNKFEALFGIHSGSLLSRYSTFSFSSDHFHFEKVPKDEPFSLIGSKFSLYGSNSNYIFNIKEKNIDILLGIKSSIKKISMKKGQYIAEFSNNLYSTISMSKDSDLLDVSIAKSLKKKLNCDITLNNVKTYSEISGLISSKIKDNLEIYSLIHEKKINIKGSQEQFDQDILIFKEAIKHIDDIKTLYNTNFNLFKTTSLFYLNIKNYITSNIQEKNIINLLNNLNILNHYKKDNNNFINNDIFEKMEELNALSQKIMKFTYDIDLNKKEVKKVKPNKKHM